MSEVGATDLTFDSLGTTIQIRSSDPVLGEVVASLFRHFPSAGGTPNLVLAVTQDHGRYRVDRNGTLVLDGVSSEKALVGVLGFVNEATVFGVSSLVVHAGAVSLDGDVIAFPASEEAGKSTLVAACLQEGFDYVTDEAVVVISAAGEVAAYPKALWLTAESLSALSLGNDQVEARLDDRYKSFVLPEALGAVVGQPPLVLRHVVLPERALESTSLEPLGNAETAVQLLTHAFNRYDRPHDWFQLTAGLAQDVNAWRLSYREAIDTPGRLRLLLEES